MTVWKPFEEPIYVTDSATSSQEYADLEIRTVEASPTQIEMVNDTKKAASDISDLISRMSKKQKPNTDKISLLSMKRNFVPRRASERIMRIRRNECKERVNPRKRKLNVSWQTDNDKFTCLKKTHGRNTRSKVINDRIEVCEEAAIPYLDIRM